MVTGEITKVAPLLRKTGLGNAVSVSKCDPRGRRFVKGAGSWSRPEQLRTRIESMKAWAKRVPVSLSGLVILLAIPVMYSTERGYTQWWLMSGEHVTVNGVQDGYLHKNWSHSAVIITRTDSKRSQSYLVRISGEEFSASMIYCSDWHAPRFLAFPIGDVKSPCMGILDNPDPPTRTVHCFQP